MRGGLPDLQRLLGAVRRRGVVQEPPRQTEHKLVRSPVGDIDEGIDGPALRAEVAARGQGDLLARVEKSITSNAVWGLAPDTAPAA